MNCPICGSKTNDPEGHREVARGDYGRALTAQREAEVLAALAADAVSVARKHFWALAADTEGGAP